MPTELHRSITIDGDISQPKNLVCPICGETDEFGLLWVGDLAQEFAQEADGERGDYTSHDQEGTNLNVEIEIYCSPCNITIMRRPITVTVEAWQYYNPKSDTYEPQPALNCWAISGPFPDSSEDHYYSWQLFPADWTEEQVRDAMVERANAIDDERLADLLEEDALFETTDYAIVNGQLYIPAQTLNARYS